MACALLLVGAAAAAALPSPRRSADLSKGHPNQAACMNQLHQLHWKLPLAGELLHPLQFSPTGPGAKFAAAHVQVCQQKQLVQAHLQIFQVVIRMYPRETPWMLFWVRPLSSQATGLVLTWMMVVVTSRPFCKEFSYNASWLTRDIRIKLRVCISFISITGSYPLHHRVPQVQEPCWLMHMSGFVSSRSYFKQIYICLKWSQRCIHGKLHGCCYRCAHCHLRLLDWS